MELFNFLWLFFVILVFFLLSLIFWQQELFTLLISDETFKLKSWFFLRKKSQKHWRNSGKASLDTHACVFHFHSQLKITYWWWWWWWWPGSTSPVSEIDKHIIFNLILTRTSNNRAVLVHEKMEFYEWVKIC